MQIGLMHPAKHAEIGEQPAPRSFARIAMSFAHAIAVVVACPLACAVADRSVFGMASRIAGRLIGIQHLRGLLNWDQLLCS
jgi:hypothetical protein